MQKNPILFILNIFFICQLFSTETFAFRESGEREDRGFQHREFHDTFHKQKPQKHDEGYDNVKRSTTEPNSLAAAHDEKVSAFSQQHFTMNPHPGIPETDNSPENYDWNRSWNNNYNFYGNEGWGWNNYGTGLNWNNGLWYGALVGATLETALLSPYKQPDYTYPISVTTPATNTTSSTTLPSDETWVSAKDGDVAQNAVINNTENGKSTYYCRTNYMNQLSYGVLVPNDGCYIETSSATTRFTTYDVLISK